MNSDVDDAEESYISSMSSNYENIYMSSSEGEILLSDDDMDQDSFSAGSLDENDVEDDDASIITVSDHDFLEHQSSEESEDNHSSEDGQMMLGSPPIAGAEIATEAPLGPEILNTDSLDAVGGLIGTMAIARPGGASNSIPALPPALIESSPFQSSLKRPRSPSPPTAGSSAVSECPICMDAWMTNGPHRVVSLKCGHLFGRECILRWIGRSSSCPNCKTKAISRDIRPIFANVIQALDTAELEELKDLKRRAAKTIDKQSAELANLRESRAREALIIELMRKDLVQQVENNRLLKIEIERLKCCEPGASSALDKSEKSSSVSCLNVALLDTTTRVDHTKPSSLPAPRPILAPFTLKQCVPIYAHAQSARVLESFQVANSILVSKAASSTNHGVLRVNLADTAFQAFLPLHKATIRDIAVFELNSLMLTTSLDKTLKLFSLSSNEHCHTFSLPAPGWSCCFDSGSSHYVYAGMSNNSIWGFDARRPDGPVVKFSQMQDLGGAGKAIHSLHSIHDSRSEYRGLFGGSMNSAFILHDGQGLGPYRCGGDLTDDGGNQGSSTLTTNRLHLPSAMTSSSTSCFSCSFDPVSNNWLSSWRSAQSGTTHHIGQFIRGLPEDSTFAFDPLNVISSSTVSVNLTRSNLFSCPSVHSSDGVDSLVVTSGDSPGAVQYWRSKLDKDSSHSFPAQPESLPLDRFSYKETSTSSGEDSGSLVVMDMKQCHIAGNPTPLLAALTKSHLFVYDAPALAPVASAPPTSIQASSSSNLFSCRL